MQLSKGIALYQHQKQSLEFMKTNRLVYDASDAGTGKTLVQICDISDRIRDKGGKALVFAPKSLVYSTWRNEFKRFAPHIEVQPVLAHKKHDFFKKADVYVTNIDAVAWMQSLLKDDFWEGFHTLVIDEATAYKRHTSKRTKLMMKLARKFEYIRLLSGTADAYSILDLWSQYKILDEGKRLGRTFSAFRSSCCTPRMVMPGVTEWIERDDIQDVVTHMVSDITIRHKLETCIDMPDYIETIMEVDMSPRVQKAYKDMEKYARMRVEGGTVTAINAATEYGKLLQIASGAAYDGDGNVVSIDRSRYELVGDLVDARHNCIVFYNWKHQRDGLMEEFDKRRMKYVCIDANTSSKKREEYVSDFQKGFYRVFLAHPKSAAHGLTLTNATTVIWATQPADPELFLQGNRRAYRAGQTKRTETVIVLSKGTIEKHALKRLNTKTERHKSTLDMMESYFKDI